MLFNPFPFKGENCENNWLDIAIMTWPLRRGGGSVIIRESTNGAYE